MYSNDFTIVYGDIGQIRYCQHRAAVDIVVVANTSWAGADWYAVAHNVGGMFKIQPWEYECFVHKANQNAREIS